VYGTRAPLRSWNPLWANAEVYWATLKDAWHARRWRDKLLVWIKPPGWRPADVAERFPKPAFDIRRERYAPALPPGLAAYGVAQFALMLPMGVWFLELAKRMPPTALLAYAAFLLFGLTALGVLLEGRRAGLWLELIRLAATVAAALATGGWFGVARPVPGMAFTVLVACIASAIVVLTIRMRMPQPA
jgi:hypothetical protein